MANILDMKTILTKCKINPTTYFLFLAFLFTGHIKNILLIFTIIFIHEMGHVFFLKRKQIPIESIEFFPFGGITKTTRPINTPINEDLLIYSGGILFQILLFGIFLLFKNGNWINENTFLLFKKYNNSIFLFNCLPICPLDGGEIVKLFLEKNIPIKKHTI